METRAAKRRRVERESADKKTNNVLDVLMRFGDVGGRHDDLYGDAQSYHGQWGRVSMSLFNKLATLNRETHERAVHLSELNAARSEYYRQRSIADENTLGVESSLRSVEVWRGLSAHANAEGDNQLANNATAMIDVNTRFAGRHLREQQKADARAGEQADLIERYHDGRPWPRDESGDNLYD